MDLEHGFRTKNPTSPHRRLPRWAWILVLGLAFGALFAPSFAFGRKFKRGRSKFTEPNKQAGLLKICPDEWIIDAMPGPDIGRPERGYYIYQGIRRELSEFNQNWINQDLRICLF